MAQRAPIFARQRCLSVNRRKNSLASSIKEARYYVKASKPCKKSALLRKGIKTVQKMRVITPFDVKTRKNGLASSIKEARYYVKASSCFGGSKDAYCRMRPSIILSSFFARKSCLQQAATFYPERVMTSMTRKSSPYSCVPVTVHHLAMWSSKKCAHISLVNEKWRSVSFMS